MLEMERDLIHCMCKNLHCAHHSNLLFCTLGYILLAAATGWQSMDHMRGNWVTLMKVVHG